MSGCAMGRRVASTLSLSRITSSRERMPNAFKWANKARRRLSGIVRVDQTYQTHEFSVRNDAAGGVLVQRPRRRRSNAELPPSRRPPIQSDKQQKLRAAKAPGHNAPRRNRPERRRRNGNCRKECKARQCNSEQTRDDQCGGAQDEA